MSIKKILCVDDEEDILVVYKYFLSEGGYEVALASNGIECGCMIDEFNPDLVILDLMMPEMDGKKVLEYMTRGPHRDKKIIVISGNLDVEISKFLDAHNILYFKKPIFDMKIVLGAIKEL